MNLLDRYLLRAWTKIFVATALGFPIIVTVIELSDKLSRLIDRDVPVAAILLGHVMGMPEKIFQVIPAAVLFATVFSIGSMCRHSEMVAVKASGRSFYRMLRPVLAGAAVAAALAFAIAELAPITTRRQAELLGEVRQRARNTRFNFVYRADGGWVYMMRSLDVAQGTIRQSIFVREGSGGDRPTFVLDAVAGRRNDSLAAWRMELGRYRVVRSLEDELVFAFDSTYMASFDETADDLLQEPKEPNEMRYGELGDYIEGLEWAGIDTRKLRVQHALKIAIPFTCLIIALFGAPLANTSPRAGGAYGVAISLGTTIVFLILVQLSQAIGAGGVLPPAVAAWSPNILFGSVGAALLARTAT